MFTEYGKKLLQTKQSVFERNYVVLLKYQIWNATTVSFAVSDNATISKFP